METGQENPIMYEFIEGEKGYWERRNNKDWDDLPNLFGQYEDE